MTDEKRLILLARRGDAEAFSVLLKGCEMRLKNTALTLCPEEAEDLLQESFLAAFKSIGRFRGRSSFYTWIYRIMLNLAYKKFRRRRHKTAFFFKLSGRQSTAPNNGTNPGEGGMTKERLRDAISGLPALYREIILLHYFEDLSVAEISRSLSINEGTVKSRLFNARALLKKEMNLPGDSGY